MLVSQERRKLPRLPIELAASYGMPEEALTMFETRITDVSMGGFCIQSRTKLERGKKMQLVFEIDGKDCVISVKVVWEKIDEKTKSYVYGVEINQPHQIEYDKLLAFVDKFNEPTSE